MNTDDFVSRFGGIYENSPWVAERAAPLVGASADCDRIATLMADIVDNASRERRLALVRAHPDLAGRAAVVGELTEASATEQASAGLDRCSPEEYERFQELNARYKARFGFPFVIAVRGRSRAEILEAFEARLKNDPETEFETAIGEIHRIARLRLAVPR